MIPLDNDIITSITLRGFSNSTCKNYLRYLKKFFHTYNKDPEELDISFVKDYLCDMISVKKYHPSTCDIIYSALKFYYCNMLKYDKSLFDFYKPKKCRKIPTVLTPKEVSNIIDSFYDIDYRMIVRLAAFTGLRVSEAVSIRTSDINAHLKTLTIRQSKGNKDRTIPIPEKLIEELREYWKTHQNKELLFPKRKSRDPDFDRKYTKEHITKEQMCKVFFKVITSLNLTKKVVFHTLRHSYATNLLECGVNIAVLKDILGHSSVNTTMQYIHMTNSSSSYSYQKVCGLMKIIDETK